MNSHLVIPQREMEILYGHLKTTNCPDVLLERVKTAIKGKPGKYQKNPNVIPEAFTYFTECFGMDPRGWKVRTEKVSRVKDHSKTLCECVTQKRYIIRRTKDKEIFSTREQARLHGLYELKKKLEDKAYMEEYYDTVQKWVKLKNTESEINKLLLKNIEFTPLFK